MALPALEVCAQTCVRWALGTQDFRTSFLCPRTSPESLRHSPPASVSSSGPRNGWSRSSKSYHRCKRASVQDAPDLLSVWELVGAPEPSSSVRMGALPSCDRSRNRPGEAGPGS